MEYSVRQAREMVGVRGCHVKCRRELWGELGLGWEIHIM